MSAIKGESRPDHRASTLLPEVVWGNPHELHSKVREGGYIGIRVLDLWFRVSGLEFKLLEGGLYGGLYGGTTIGVMKEATRSLDLVSQNRWNST